MEIDRCERCSLVLVADLPAASALAFPHALRLERPARGLDVEILSIAPQFLGSEERRSRLIRRTDTDFELESGPEAYLDSYIERAFLGERQPLSPGETIDRPTARWREPGSVSGNRHAVAVAR